MTNAFDDKSSPKQKGFNLPTFQCYLGNPAFLNACFEISSNQNPVMIMAYELMKYTMTMYNRSQILVNEPALNPCLIQQTMI